MLIAPRINVIEKAIIIGAKLAIRLFRRVALSVKNNSVFHNFVYENPI